MFKIPLWKAGAMAQIVECLRCKHKAIPVLKKKSPYVGTMVIFIPLRPLFG